MSIGQTIAEALEAKGLTQAELAKRLEITRSTVHAWVHGQAEPRLDSLSRIADALDTSVAELMAGRWRKTRGKPAGRS